MSQLSLNGLLLLLLNARLTFGTMQTIFSDNFNESTLTWIMYEELVNGNPCYMNDDYQNSNCLNVWSNALNSNKSDHVIASKTIANTTNSVQSLGHSLLRYEFDTLIPSSTMNDGQTGPEFSIQITRNSSDMVPPNTTQFRTHTSGLQLIVNKYINPPYWNVWTSIDNTTNAKWIKIAQNGLPNILSSDIWYTITFFVDFSTNYYVNCSLMNKSNGNKWFVDLSEYYIVPEIKFSGHTAVITLEAENIWTTCQEQFNYSVLYTNVNNI
eukprot:408911_1